MLWILLLIFVLGLGYYWLRRPYNYWTQKGVFQQDPVILFGNFLPVLARRVSIFDYVRQSYSKNKHLRYVGVYQFSAPVFQIQDPDLIKQFLVKDFDHFADHVVLFSDGGSAIWSRNLLTLKGKEWRDMRSIVSPSFTGSKMKIMFTLMDEVALNLVDYFKTLGKDETEVELKDVFSRYANDVIASTSFGIQVNSMKDKENEFYLMGKKITNLQGFGKAMKFFLFFMCPKICEIFKISFFEKEVTDFFINVIKENIRKREEEHIIRPDMIHLMMEAKKGNQKHKEVEDTGFAVIKEQSKVEDPNRKIEITDIDIAAQGITFFFAGFDSVSTLMSFMGFELAAHPEIQSRLRDEVRETLKNCPGGKLTYEAVMQMKYMDMVVTEALRKWPNAVAGDRVCTKPYTVKAEGPEEVDVDLAPGTVISIPIVGFHYDEKYYPDPEKFDPERFNDQNKAKVNPYTYLPFGAGPRGCIGSRFALLEAKVVFFHLLKDFELVPCAKSVIPVKASKNHLALAAEGGLWCNIKRL